MTPRPGQRGEGKIGCFLTLLVFAILAATAAKIVPVYYSNNEIIDFADDEAAKAGVYNVDSLRIQVLEKARNLEIAEALAPGAIEVSTAGTKTAGTCTIHLKWSRKVDLYGAYVLVLETDKTISRQYLDTR